MNKTSKHKHSTKTTTSSHSMTIKHGESLTTKTIKTSNKKLSIKKLRAGQKFKSILSVPYQDGEIYSLPTQYHVYQSHTTHPVEAVKDIQQSEPRLLFCMSDRNKQSGNKVMAHSKPRRSSQSKRTMRVSKIQVNTLIKTSRNEQQFSHIYQRTKQLLNQYKDREIGWRKQKYELVKQLKKYRQRQMEQKIMQQMIKKYKKF